MRILKILHKVLNGASKQQVFETYKLPLYTQAALREAVSSVSSENVMRLLK
ncbi:hypothetical protein IQ243_16810 [Nostocales cyanobacterium LEGE 11386]|nr:hypothetical protein [Nostocales cyanobacterium LEGE 11386]